MKKLLKFLNFEVFDSQIGAEKLTLLEKKLSFHGLN